MRRLEDSPTELCYCQPTPCSRANSRHDGVGCCPFPGKVLGFRICSVSHNCSSCSAQHVCLRCDLSAAPPTTFRECTDSVRKFSLGNMVSPPAGGNASLVPPRFVVRWSENDGVGKETLYSLTGIGPVSTYLTGEKDAPMRSTFSQCSLGDFPCFLDCCASG